MTRYDLWVPGDPVGQPRPRACIRGRHAGVYDPGTADGWKQAIAARVPPGAAPMDGPVSVTLSFLFARPASHVRTNGAVKPSAPSVVAVRYDVDNLAKAVLDVLTTRRVWHDDAQVARLTVTKAYAALPMTAGCFVTIATLEPGR